MMTPWQERVVAEKTELEGKLVKLGTFINESPAFRVLDSGTQTLYYAQYNAMNAYCYILAARIERFT